MKKIANKVALMTILYRIGGMQKIKVIDYENNREAMNRGRHNVVFEGLYKDENYNIFKHWHEYAEVRSIEPDGETLVIGICTAEEIY